MSGLGAKIIFWGDQCLHCRFRDRNIFRSSGAAYASFFVVCYHSVDHNRSLPLRQSMRFRSINKHNQSPSMIILLLMMIASAADLGKEVHVDPPHGARRIADRRNLVESGVVIACRSASLPCSSSCISKHSPTTSP